MKPRRINELILATLLLFLGFIGSAVAQSPDTPDTNVSYPSTTQGQAPGQTNTDPPGRVARVQYMNGEVSIQPGGMNDWVAANLNRPLTTSDRVWTDKNSKAELNVGGAYLRLNSETSLTLTNVSDNTVQVQLDQGVLELTVNYLGAGQIYEVDTANVAFTVMKPGVYRINTYPSEDQTWVTVRKGQGEATGRGSAVKVKSGEQVRFSGGTSLAHTSESAPAPDGFDDWASVRDKRLESSQSARYVSPGVIGYQDLDAYGTWQTIAPYGPVWVPSSVPVGWAPYRYGRWAWIAPWGWTWVDDAAWGFAPFHYGRWVYTSGYWGWAPGPYRYWSPCYAPALVGWVGGPGWGAGFGFGGAGWGASINFGWFPLGWGEPYYPWYHGWHGRGLSPTYIRNVNVSNTYITNVTNITNNYYRGHYTNATYVNRNVNGAVTAAPVSAITNGQPINRYGATVTRSQLMHAPMMRGIDATPTREAMLGGQSQNRHLTPPPAAVQRTVVTHTAPPEWSRAGAATSPASTPPAAPVTITGAHPTTGSPNPSRAPVPYASPAAAASVTTAQPSYGSQPGAVHNVPRPPRAGENADAAIAMPGNTTRPVPRPPAHSAAGYAAGPTYAPAAPYGSSNAVHPTSSQRSVPYSPPAASTTHVNPAPSATSGPPATAPAVHAPPARESTPSHGGKPESKSPSPSPGMASAVPRPPSNYSYHAAPAYAANGRGYAPGNSYTSGSTTPHGYSYTGGYSAAPTYTRHGSYAGGAGYSTPVTRSGGYGAAPSYGMQHATPYASPPAASYSGGGHYSAPAAYSGGGAHPSAPSGGGSSHASHGSGGARSR